ncbi:major facilitator superfamily domain-containing protein [Apiosordaria backusii]|uniref:Major facilitator superfamily domain-containing protein n=1 Tax=Apiosordaria backusii TaxID=314023 RepID=A0AA40ASM6_9PEZI|nr:major facilitator superfamily domain-containing protein [Apiosordaria backusii]
MPTRRHRPSLTVMPRSRVGTSSSVERGEIAPKEELDWKPGKQEYAVMITLAIISLMVALDATILVSVLPTLAIDLGGSATDAFWAGTSYLLSCAVCQPFIAALSDIFGRKEMLIFSVLFFTLGTVLCAPIAKNFTVFFAGRSVQGIGGGGIITMGQVIFADIVPLRQRPKYFSLVLAAWALGSVLGPLIGGLFVEKAFWSWCFYINLPFCALGLVLIPCYVKLTTQRTSLRSKLGRVDWLGGFLFIGGLTSFLVGMSWGGVQFEWSSAQVIAPMVVGVISVIMCVVWESYGAREPFLRPQLFHSGSALAAYACALFQGFILFCALYYVPFYFTAVRFEKPTQSGLDIFPVTCLLLPGSIVVSLISSRTGHYRWAIWSGWAITAIGCGLLRLFNTNTPTPVWAVILAVFGIGHGILLTSVNVGIQAISRVEDAGRAAAMYAFMRTMGMSIGVAVGGTVFQNLMIKKLNELGMPEEIAHNSEAFVVQMEAMDPTDPVRVGALQAYVAGFHGVYWTITGASVAAFLISLFMKRHSMDKILATKFVLEGARRPPGTHLPPAVMTNAIITTQTTASSSSSPSQNKFSMSSDHRLPPLFKDSSAMPSAFDSESTYTMAKSTTNAEEESSSPSPSPEPQELEGNNTTAVEVEVDTAAVAYFVEASGRIVPVDILPEHQPVSRTGSVFEYGGGVCGGDDRLQQQQQHDQNEENEKEECYPRYPLWEPQPGEDEVIVDEDVSPEELFERAWGRLGSSIHSASEEDRAEQEAVLADLAPEWMQEQQQQQQRSESRAAV